MVFVEQPDDHGYLGSLAGHAVWVYSVATAVLDGRVVVITGGLDGTRAWDLASARRLPGGQSGTQMPLAEYDGGVFGMTTAVLDGRVVVITGGFDATVRIWDLATGRQIRSPMAGHAGTVSHIATAVLDDRLVAVTCDISSEERYIDTTVRVWDVEAGRQLGPARPASGSYVATAVLDGRPIAVTANDDTQPQAWDLAGGRLIGRPLTDGGDNVYAVATGVLNDRPIAATCDTREPTVRVWDLATGNLDRRLPTDHPRGVWAVTVTTLNGLPTVITSGDDGIRLHDLTTNRELAHVPTDGTFPVQAVATAALNGHDIAITSGDGPTPRIWDLTAT